MKMRNLLLGVLLGLLAAVHSTPVNSRWYFFKKYCSKLFLAEFLAFLFQCGFVFDS